MFTWQSFVFLRMLSLGADYREAYVFASIMCTEFDSGVDSCLVAHWSDPVVRTLARSRLFSLALNCCVSVAHSVALLRFLLTNCPFVA
jgi:hypothetical protein